MHELSIATNLVEIASRKAAEVEAKKVNSVHMRLGVLSGVVRDALKFSFDVATQGTVLEDAALDIEDVPAVAFCQQCEVEKQLTADRAFRACCPDCGTPTPDIRQGRELEITALEVER